MDDVRPTPRRTIPGYVAPEVGLSKLLQEAWKQQLLFDYTIQVGDAEFQVHKVVMACVSDYFRAMLSGGMLESQADSVRLEELVPLAVSNIIEYIYTNSIHGVRASPEDLLACAMYLQIPLAIEAATNMLHEKIDKKNCFDILTIFKTYSLKDAVEHTERYINKNLDDILRVCEREKVPYEYMGTVIDQWKGGEWDLFLTIKDWVDLDYEKRKQHLDSLLTKVQFYLLTPAESEAIKKMKLYTEGTWQKQLQWGQEYRRLPIEKKMMASVSVRGEPTVVGFSRESSSTMYTLQEDEWKRCDIPATPDFSAGLVATFEFSNFLIVCEGYLSQQKWHVLDPTTLTWSRMASMNIPRFEFTMVHDEENLYALGGRTDSVVTTMIERYNIKSNMWTVLPTILPVPLYKHSACLCSDSSIYITGGRGNEDMDLEEDEFSIRLDCFNPSEDSISWQSKSPRGNGFRCLLMREVAFNGKMHIVVLSSPFCVQSYDLETDHWTSFYNPTVQRPVWHDKGTIVADRRKDTFKFYIVNTYFRPIHSNPMLMQGFCAKWTWNGKEEQWDDQDILQGFPIHHYNSDEGIGKNYITALLSLSLPSHRPSDLEAPTPSVRKLYLV